MLFAICCCSWGLRGLIDIVHPEPIDGQVFGPARVPGVLKGHCRIIITQWLEVAVFKSIDVL
jgi:hypothetical protein